MPLVLCEDAIFGANLVVSVHSNNHFKFFNVTKYFIHINEITNTNTNWIFYEINLIRNNERKFCAQVCHLLFWKLLAVSWEHGKVWADNDTKDQSHYSQMKSVRRMATIWWKNSAISFQNKSNHCQTLPTKCNCIIFTIHHQIK